MIRQSTIARQVGRKYGFLTVISFAKKEKKNQYFYLCRCDCGTEKTVRVSCLQQGTTKSCGCYATERNRLTHGGNTYRRLPAGQSALNTLYGHYRKDAVRRGFAFSLTKEEFADLVIKPCFYCAAPPAREFGGPNYNGKIVCSGVDRVDNADGYTGKNCVPCCKACNSTKNSVTKEMVYKIYHRLFPTAAPQSTSP